jgi:hypothetical protein
LAEPTYVAIRRVASDDDPDEILDVRAFGDKMAALAYAADWEARWDAYSAARKAWHYAEEVEWSKIYEEQVRHKHDKEARARGREMLHAVMREHYPDLVKPDDFWWDGFVEIYECRDGEAAKLVHEGE